MMTMDELHLVILTPEKTIVEKKVSKVTLPGSKGAFMVLRNHAPLISSLDEGDIIFSSSETEETVHVLSGFVQIRNNRITVCAEV